MGGVKLDPEAVAHPCGLVAATSFTDVFTKIVVAGDEYALDGDEIVWESDKENFKNRNNYMQV